MKNRTRKILALILAVITVAGILAACADKDPDTGKSTDKPVESVTAEETRLYADIPEGTNYGGAEFKMLHWEIDGFPMLRDLDAESTNADLINDAVYYRNLSVEDMLGITIIGDYDTHSNVITTCTNAVASGDQTYNVYFPRSYESQQLVKMGALYDISALQYNDFTAPWWDAQSISEFSILGKLLMAETNITLMDKAATICFYYDKQVQADLKIEDLYQLVYNNEWTWDKMAALAKTATYETSGDQELDGKDNWGLVAYDDFTYGMLHGADARYASKDSDDIPYCSFNNERTISVAQKILDIMMDSDYFFHTNNLEDNTTVTDMLVANQWLFYLERISQTANFRSVETDFGILPVPKFDSDQEKYGHSVSIHQSSVLTIPITIEDPEMVSIVIEALACESTYTVIPKYYDVVLKDKYTRDEESVDMLDIILTNRVYDLGEFYQFGTFNEMFLRAYPNSRDVASLFAKYEKQIDSDIDKLVEVIEKKYLD